jgi:hypothetical protein
MSRAMTTETFPRLKKIDLRSTWIDPLQAVSIRKNRPNYVAAAGKKTVEVTPGKGRFPD